jgi:SAM-dependent methyltransferase
MAEGGGPPRDPTLPRVGPGEVLRALPAAGRAVRLYVRARYAICPFDEVARAVPRRGTVVDVGCGFGLFALHLRLQAAERRVLGIDHDPRRIEAARRSPLAGHGVEFAVADAPQASLPPCDAVVLIDVLHHLHPEAQARLLAAARARLVPGGRIVVKDLDTRPRFRFVWNWVHDVLMTRSLDLHFRSRAATEAALVAAGFADVRSRRLPTRAPYAHVLYTGERGPS